MMESPDLQEQLDLRDLSETLDQEDLKEIKEIQEKQESLEPLATKVARDHLEEKEDQELLDHKEQKANQESQEPKELLVSRDFQDPMVFKELRVSKVGKEALVLLVPPETKVTKEPWVTRDSLEQMEQPDKEESVEVLVSLELEVAQVPKDPTD